MKIEQDRLTKKWTVEYGGKVVKVFPTEKKALKFVQKKLDKKFSLVKPHNLLRKLKSFFRRL